MESLFLLVLSMLAIESASSIRLLYKHFLSRVTEKSLNAFYYACSYAKIDCSKFMNVTARLSMQIIPESLQNEPVFLCIDDTMIANFGKKFENVSKLFDHAAHNGSNYLNGHCFVSLMLCVPVWKKNKIVYQSIPLGYRMWTKEVSKLELAADMVRTVMPELEHKHQVLLLFDRWYAKKALVCLASSVQLHRKLFIWHVHGRKKLHLTKLAKSGCNTCLSLILPNNFVIDGVVESDNYIV